MVSFCGMLVNCFFVLRTWNFVLCSRGPPKETKKQGQSSKLKVLFSKQLPNLFHRHALSLLLADGNEYRVFACNSSDDFRNHGAVYFHRDRRSQSRLSAGNY